MNTLIQEILELVEQYALKIRNDHHKTKDGYFEVTLSFSAYRKRDADLVISAEHHGYLNHWDEPASTVVDALRITRDNLRQAIAEYVPEDEVEW